MARAIAALIFLVSATILLIFASLAAQGTLKVSFLDVGSGPDAVQYGIFGPRGSRPRIGYQFPPPGSSGPGSSAVPDSVTKALLLHPIAGGLAALSAIMSIPGHRTCNILMVLTSAIATVITLTVFCLDMTLFGVVSARYRVNGVPAQYGNANWITLGAFGALAIGFCFGVRTVYAVYKNTRRERYT